MALVGLDTARGYIITYDNNVYNIVLIMWRGAVLKARTRVLHWYIITYNYNIFMNIALTMRRRAVFEAHTRGVAFDPAASAAEWWVQVRERR